MAVRAEVACLTVFSVTNAGKATVRWVGYTSRRKSAWRRSSAFVPSLSRPAWSARFPASMERMGFSSAKGSGRVPLPGRNVGGGRVRPPSYAGMLPSAFPARSAPTGVSASPSCLASSGEMPALAGGPISARSEAATNELRRFMSASSLR